MKKYLLRDHFDTHCVKDRERDLPKTSLRTIFSDGDFRRDNVKRNVENFMVPSSVI
jgi:hypothetical protein